MRTVCAQSFEGKCEYSFSAVGVYHFSSGFVEKDSKISFGVSIHVHQRDSFTSNITVKVKGVFFRSLFT